MLLQIVFSSVTKFLLDYNFRVLFAPLLVRSYTDFDGRLFVLKSLGRLFASVVQKAAAQQAAIELPPTGS